ncbi:MAG: prephenate dehydratase [Alphaproteobacteria bacterium]
MTAATRKIIAFGGSQGAYSDLACRAVFPDDVTLPCLGFEEAFAAVRESRADRAMIPVENAIAGRVADVHHLLPQAGLHIVGEHYQPVTHHLLALPGVRLEDIKTVKSHVQALTQCHIFIRKHKLTPVAYNDTAGAAAEIKATQNRALGAIASELAGKIYGLDSLATDIADQKGNTTRFLILARDPEAVTAAQRCMTSLIFRVRSVPAALYKALGGFATNGVNITKLESYLVDGNFTAAQFYVDLEGHPDSTAMQNALEELAFFADEVKILGTYPAHPFRDHTT